MKKSIMEFKKLGLERDLIGVEIGVHAGDNALNILKNVNLEKLYLVDPYEDYIETGNTILSPNSLFYDNVERLISFKDKIKWIKKKADKAINDIPNDLDFVYIDGNHSPENVRKEIEDYYPKIRKGGILSGHDYNFGHVKIEVDKFSESVGYKVFSVTMPVLGTDWWIFKNEK